MTEPTLEAIQWAASKCADAAGCPVAYRKEIVGDLMAYTLTTSPQPGDPHPRPVARAGVSGTGHTIDAAKAAFMRALAEWRAAQLGPKNGPKDSGGE